MGHGPHDSRRRAPAARAALAGLVALLTACGGEAESHRQDPACSGDSCASATPTPTSIGDAAVTVNGVSWDAVATHPRVGEGSAAVISPDGTATLVWVDGGARNRLMSQVQPPGGSWGQPFEVPTHGRVQTFVTAGVDREGTVTAVWSTDESERLRYRLWAAQLPTGGVWTQPVRIAGGPSEDIGLINWDLSVGPSGAAVLVWWDESAVELHAAYRRGRSGEWTEPIVPPEKTPTPTLATTVDSDGVATLAYLTGDELGGAGSELTLLQATPSGWGEPVKLPQPVGRRPYAIDAAGAGEVVAVWQADDRRLLGVRLEDGKPSTSRTLATSDTRAATLVLHAAADGTARVIWDTGGLGGREVRSVEWRAGASAGRSPQVLGTVDFCALAWSTLEVAGNDAGDTLVTWSAAPNGLEFAFRGRDDDTWAPQEGVVPHGHGPNCQGQVPTLAVNEGSQLLATWVDSHTRKIVAGTTVLSRRGQPDG